ncbi:MAG TPA: bacillithiol transferase BstA [Bacteroidia bacterium]
MTPEQLDQLRFPIGKFSIKADAGEAEMKKYISEIEKLPALLRKALEGLDDKHLDTPYRDGGWTVRQTVHHLADSHINAYVRVKLALTENNPAIKTYDENAWAKLPDSSMPVEASLSLLDGLHRRWVFLLKQLSAQDMKKTVFHPERKADISISFFVQLYAWHCAHHTAHITELRKRMK